MLAEKAPSLLKLTEEVLAWLPVWSKVQILARGPADANATPSSLLLPR